MQQHPNPIFYGLLYVDKSNKGTQILKVEAIRSTSICAVQVYAQDPLPIMATASGWSRMRGLGSSVVCVAGPYPIGCLGAGVWVRRSRQSAISGGSLKLELYKLLGSGRFGDHVGVIDIDSVMIASVDFPPSSPGAILVYDITDQVLEEYGGDGVRSDFDRVSGTTFIRVQMAWG